MDKREAVARAIYKSMWGFSAPDRQPTDDQERASWERWMQTADAAIAAYEADQ